MSLAIMRKEVLEILAENINISYNPGVVDSDFIAAKLHISLPQLIEVLKSMNEMGLIISNVENQYSIITSNGLNFLNQHQLIPRTVQQRPSSMANAAR